MSVINKMLQELDRRNAVGGVAAQAAVHTVKPVGTLRRGHEWFWRVLAGLVLVSVSWVGWVAYQLQPRPLVTPLALMAAEQRPAAPEKPSVVAVAEAPKPEPVESQPIAAPETFKLARSIETPMPAREPRAPSGESKKPALAPTPPPAPAPKVVLDKRERSKGAADLADARFRRAAALLGQARISEAEEQLAAALQADASHMAARQAYVALLLEQQRVSSALRLLREAVDANPAQPVFALGLARVYAEQREYAAALAVIDAAGPAAQGAEFQVLRAAMLQRLGQHAEAVASYQEALHKSAQPGGTWTGLGISLEALGRPEEAMQAYQRALHAGALPNELRDYAESRIRVLQ